MYGAGTKTTFLQNHLYMLFNISNVNHFDDSIKMYSSLTIFQMNMQKDVSMISIPVLPNSS